MRVVLLCLIILSTAIHAFNYLPIRYIITKTMATDDDWETVPVRRGKKRSTSEIIDLVDSPPQRSGKSVSRQPFVLILVGLPGSGKSHFASCLESVDSRFVRINQDTLKTRKKCEALARKTLIEGNIAVIDRTNFNCDQRKTWIDIAKENNVDVHCVVFDTGDRDVYVSRCQQRTGHETVHPSKAATVVSILYKQFRPPIVRSRNGKIVQCTGGETFSSLDVVTSFNQSNSIANRFIDH